tara:strand:+ start:1349 stop:1651 length:303 start_codon:yes stop_codon:yes gene_type:complete
LTSLTTGVAKNVVGIFTQNSAKNQKKKMSVYFVTSAILLTDKKGETMNCWHCNEELIWGGDHDLEKGYGTLSDEYCVETNLSCPECGSFVLVYYPREKNE